jgi:aromatic ring-opening dioxygenase LigB subunit
MKKKTTTEPKVKRPVGRPRKTPKKITITRTQAEIANRLGLTVEEYIHGLKPSRKRVQMDKNLDKEHIRELNARVAELEYQNIGFRSVISYLETQLGLTQTQ